jgi:septal ring factor EnvC (AmiA/AmiB activator)
MAKKVKTDTALLEERVVVLETEIDKLEGTLGSVKKENNKLLKKIEKLEGKTEKK